MATRNPTLLGCFLLTWLKVVPVLVTVQALATNGPRPSPLSVIRLTVPRQMPVQWNIPLTCILAVRSLATLTSMGLIGTLMRMVALFGVMSPKKALQVPGVFEYLKTMLVF